MRNRRQLGFNALFPGYRAVFFGICLVVASTADANVPAKPSSYYEDALVQYTAGDFKGATIQLKNALQATPKNLPARILLAKVYLAQGFGANAEQEIKAAAADGADQSVTVPLLGRAYLQQLKAQQLLSELSTTGLNGDARVEFLVVRGQAQLDVSDAKGALSTFREAAELAPTKPEPLLGMVTAHLRLNNLQAAEEAATKASQLVPDSGIVFSALAAVAQAKQDLKRADELYSRALELSPFLNDARIARIAIRLQLGRDSETNEDLEYESQNNSFDPRPMYLKAIALARGDDIRGAREQMGKANAILDTVNPAWIAKNIVVLRLAGTANYGLGEYERARKFFLNVVANDPGATEIQKLLAACDLALGEPDAAIKVLESPGLYGSEDPQVLTLMANAWMAKGDNNKASRLLQRAASAPAGGAVAATTLAMNHMSRGKFEIAQKELTGILNSDSKNVHALLLMAVLHQQKGEYDKAIQLTERLLETAPSNVVLLNLLASAQAASGKRDAARKTLERTLAVMPNFITAKINLARLDLADGKTAEARDRLVEALRAQPNNAQIALELARIEGAEGKNDSAIKVLEQVRNADGTSLEVRLALADLLIKGKLLDRARDVIAEARKLAPNDLLVLEMQARLYGADDKLPLAQGTFKTMADLAGFNSEWLVRIAMQQIALGAYRDAQYALSKAQEGQADYQPAWVLGTQLALERGNRELAKKQLDVIVDRWPEAAVTDRLQGDYASQQGDAARALQHYQRFFDKTPSTAGIERIVSTLLQARRADDAIRSLQDWLSKNPKDETALRLLAKANLAKGDKAAARVVFEQIVSLSPDDVASLNNLAYLSDEAGREDALELARKAYKLAPNDPHVCDTLGWILVRKNKSGEGLQYLREAEARLADAGAIKFHIATALVALDRKDEARKVLAEALHADQEFEGKAAAFALAKKLGAQ